MRLFLVSVWKQIWITGVVLLVLLALYTSVGRQLMPSLTTLKPELELELSQQLKTPVVIDKLIGGWGWFAPVVTLQGVRIGEGVEQVSLEMLAAELDISASAFYQQVVFKKILLQGVNLQFREPEAEQWYLGQWSLSSKGDQENSGKPAWLSLLEVQQEVQIQNSYITFYPFDNEARRLEISDIRLRNLRQQHWLDGRVTLPGKADTELAVQMEIEGDLWQWQDLHVNGYSFIPQQDWQAWLQFFSVELSQEFKFDALTAGAELWFDLKKGQLEHLAGHLDLPELELQLGNKTKDNLRKIELSATRLQLFGNRYQGDWHAWYNFDQVADGDTQIKNSRGLDLYSILPLTGSLSWLPSVDQKAYQFSLNNTDLSRLSNLILAADVLAPRHAKYIEQLAPRGQADNINSYLLLKDETRSTTQFIAELDASKIDTAAWNGIPGIKEGGGHVMFNKRYGRVLAEQQDLSLQVADLYDEPWQLDNVDAQVFWQVEKEYARILSTHMFADYRSGKLAGNFSLHLPMQPADISQWDPQIHLQFAFRDMQLGWQKAFVPQQAVGAETSNWLNNSIVGGQANFGVFNYFSDLTKKVDKNSRRMQFYLDVLGADIQYLKDWPQLKNVKARMLMVNEKFDAWIHSANTLGGQLVNNSGRVKLRRDKQKYIWLTVAGSIQGSTKEGLSYLQTTPLRDQVAGAFDDWQASGDMSAKIRLSLPLNAKPEQQDKLSDIQLQTEIKNSQLYVAGLNLRAEKLNGALTYTNKAGISSEQLSAEVMGGKVTSRIYSNKVGQGFDIFLTGQGRASIEKIQEWNPVYLLKPLSGEFDYQTQVDIKPLKRGGLTFQLHSDLAGVAMDIPYPFNKQEQQIRALDLNINKTKDTRLSFKYHFSDDTNNDQDVVNGVFSLGAGGIERGQVYFGNNSAFLPSDSGIKIKGKLQHSIDAIAWWDLWQSIKPDSAEGENQDTIAGQAKERELNNNQLNDVDIRIDDLLAFGNQFGTSHIQGQYQWQQWLLNIDSELLKGEVVLSDNQDPIKMNLDYLHFPPSAISLDDKGFEQDSLAELNPYLIPQLDMKVAEIFANTTNHGRWDISLRQKVDESNNPYALIRINDADSKATRIKGDIWWRYGEGLREYRHVTEMKSMRVKSYNLAATQQAFRKPVSVESKKATFYANLDWQGSPLFFNVASLSGDVSVKIKDGFFTNKETAALNAFGVLNVNSITRRLKLDFSDLYQEGVSFDILKAKMNIRNGVMTFSDPLWMDGPSAKFLLSGTTNLITQELDQKLAVTFPVTSSLPLVAVLAGFTPQVAGAIYITEKLIGEELEKFTSASYTLKGNWSKPELKIDSAFDNDVDGKETKGLGQRFLDIFGLGDD